jgi:hypothetical protein
MRNRKPHAWLRADARGCDDSVREKLARGPRNPPFLPLNGVTLIGAYEQQKEVFYDTRPILALLVLAVSIPPLYAQSSVYTDRSGYTTGTQDGRGVNTYTDQYGNTTGWVGGKYQNTYSDGYGGTTGTVGNKRINTYDDGYGNTRGTIGRDRINLHTVSLQGRSASGG